MHFFRFVCHGNCVASTISRLVFLTVAAVLVLVGRDVAFVESLAPKRLLPCPATKWSHPPVVAYSSETSVATGGLSTEVPSQEPNELPFLTTIARPSHLGNTNSESCSGDAAECEWIRHHASDILDSVHQHGAVVLEGFESPKTQTGFRAFCEALSPKLEACEDSLAEIGVRSLLSASDGVYKAVDSESMASTFIGLHNDCTFRLAPPYAAFGCLHQADKGGEFLLADGQAVLSAMDPKIVEKLCKRGLRVRVAALATPFLAKSSKDEDGWLRDFGSNLLNTVASLGVKALFPKLGLEVAFSEEGDLLQILEPLKSPLNGHPRDGKLSFFSGIHSQSAYLQQKRTKTIGGPDKLATTDVFYGEEEKGKPMGVMEPHVLDHMESIFDNHTVPLTMKPGDVVLLDSYRVLHGRATFEGFREHAVIWLTSDDF